MVGQRQGVPAGEAIVGQRLLLMADLSAGRPDAAALASAFAGGDVAAVLLRNVAPAERTSLRQAVVTAQEAGAAALLEAGPELARALGADGVHLDAEADDLAEALAEASGLIVGIGGLRSRHAAMIAGERDIDYVMFGDIRDPFAPPHPRAIDDAAWWADTFVVPAVLVGGPSLDGLEAWVEAGAEFIALEAAVWSDPDGPAAAVARINRALQREPSVAA